ncbi:F-box/kelch-repeat protein-like protein [Drosera capensis]
MLLANRAVFQQHPRSIEVSSEAGVVQRHGIPTVPSVDVDAGLEEAAEPLHVASAGGFEDVAVGDFFERSAGSREIYIDIVGACNGLVCYVLNNDINDGNGRIFLFNPSTRSHKLITAPQGAILQPCDTSYSGMVFGIRAPVAMGFGYDNINDDYVVVTYLYSLKSNSWKEHKSEGCFSLRSLDGSDYWFEIWVKPTVDGGSLQDSWIRLVRVTEGVMLCRFDQFVYPIVYIQRESKLLLVTTHEHTRLVKFFWYDLSTRQPTSIRSLEEGIEPEDSNPFLWASECLVRLV